MYPGQHAVQRADQPAVIMAESGETITYRELEARSNRLAHLLRAVGLNRLDHYGHLHGEPPALRRMLLRGRAIWALLHRHQFVSDRGRTRLHHQQQSFEST